MTKDVRHLRSDLRFEQTQVFKPEELCRWPRRPFDYPTKNTNASTQWQSAMASASIGSSKSFRRRRSLTLTSRRGAICQSILPIAMIQDEPASGNRLNKKRLGGLACGGGWETGIRTPILRSRAACPTIRRSPNGAQILPRNALEGQVDADSSCGGGLSRR